MVRLGGERGKAGGLLAAKQCPLNQALDEPLSQGPAQRISSTPPISRAVLRKKCVFEKNSEFDAQYGLGLMGLLGRLTID
jgi:hypothetical protein